MTECTIVREEMLDAAPDELAGVAPTRLATHLRDCPRCGPIARMILAEEARLGSALALMQPRRSPGAAASEILAAEEPVPVIAETRRERIGRLAASVFPLAAAAALAAYVVYGNPEPVPYAGDFVETPATMIRITATPGTGTIVLNTSDPEITFAWIGKEIVP